MIATETKYEHKEIIKRSFIRYVEHGLRPIDSRVQVAGVTPMLMKSGNSLYSSYMQCCYVAAALHDRPSRVVIENWTVGGNTHEWQLTSFTVIEGIKWGKMYHTDPESLSACWFIADFECERIQTIPVSGPTVVVPDDKYPCIAIYSLVSEALVPTV